MNVLFETRTTPQEEAFLEKVDEGHILALLELHNPEFQNQQWPDQIDWDRVDEAYEAYLSGICWLQQATEEGHERTSNRYFGEWLRCFEWGLLEYLELRQFRFVYLHAWLVRLMEKHGTTSVKGLTANEVIR